MGGFRRLQDRAGLRGLAAERRCSLGSVELLEPRGRLGGIGIAMASDGRTYAVAMIFLALTGAFLVSYTRARAEGLGIDSNKGGLFSRTERLILIGFALLLGGWGYSIEVIMTILAAGTLITFAQRLFYVDSVLRDADGPPDAR